MLKVSRLTKYYQHQLALEDVSFSVDDGEIVGLLGPNGAGKTTSLRCITGIVQPTMGKIEVDGLELDKNEADVKLRLAFVPEVPNLYEMLTVIEHVEFTARAFRTLRNFSERCEDLLRRFDLWERKDDLVIGLSKGMKQKLAVVCAFIHNARTILLDEPLIGIDPKGARELKDIILKAKSDGCSILISTHMLDTAEKLCDRIVILMKGHKLAEGSLEELHERAKLGVDATLEDVFLNLTEVDTAGEGASVSDL